MTLSDPLQLISVLLIGAGIFLFDPQKIPETARAMGRVRKEFESAQRSFRQVTGELQKPAGTSDQAASETLIARLIGGSPPHPLEEGPALHGTRSADEILVDTAHELEISTPGKTREAISQEILTKIRSSKQRNSSVASLNGQ